MALDITEQELSDSAFYLQEYGRRLSRLLPAMKAVQAFGGYEDVSISLDELVPLDIEAALRPFRWAPLNYLPFRWALRDLQQKLRAVTEESTTSRRSPRELQTFLRKATRAVQAALYRLHRADTDESWAIKLKQPRPVARLRKRVRAFDDFVRTPLEVIEVIRAYRARLDDHLSPLGYAEAAHELTPGPVPCLLHPLWVLPYPRKTIDKALRTALRSARDPRIKRNLQSDLERLKNYVPSGQIPENITQHIESWQRVHGS